MISRVYVITWERSDRMESPPIRCLSLEYALSLVQALLEPEVQGVYAVTVTTSPPMGEESRSG